jgi:hypothetical protein
VVVDLDLPHRRVALMWDSGVIGPRYRPLSSKPIQTKVLGALWECLFLIEAYCNQLASELQLRQLDNAIHTAQQAFGALRAGTKACRRVTAGLRELNDSPSAFNSLNYHLNNMRIRMIALLKCVRAGTAEPEILQLVDGLHVAINDDLQR